MYDFNVHLKESLAQEIKSEPKSEAAIEAKKLGLTYAGFGRYTDKTGEVKFIVVNKKLVPFKSSEEIETDHSKAEEASEKANTKKPEQRAKDKANKLEKSAKGGERAVKELDRQAKKFKREATKEVINLHKKLTQLYRPELFTDQEISALQDYSTVGFEDINKYLYKGFDPETDVQTANDTVAKIEMLDAAFEESGAPFDYPVYTGLGARYDYRKIKVDKDYTFRGYISSSLDTNVASDAFTSAGPWGDEPDQIASMLQINIKTGQKSIYMGNFAEDPTDFETVLPRGTKIRVVSGPDIVDSQLIAQYGPTKIAVFNCEIVEE